MGKKFAGTINRPLLYITQPAYTETKAKMQHSYVSRPIIKYSEETPFSAHDRQNSEIDKKESVELQVAPESETTSLTTKALPVPESETTSSLQPVLHSVESESSPTLDTQKHKGNIEPTRPAKSRIHSFNKIQTIRAPKQEIQSTTEDAIPNYTGSVPDPIKLVLPVISTETNESTETNMSTEKNVDEVQTTLRKSVVTGIIKNSFEMGNNAKKKVKKVEKPIGQVENQVKSLDIEEIENPGNKDVVATINEGNEDTVETEVIEVQKPRPFRELNIQEKVEYLLDVPAVLPKVKCEFQTKEETHIGVVEGFKNGIVQIIRNTKPNRIQINLEDIISINRVSF
ncbi:CotO family spore coat protein [Bacillus sp. Marseille-P3661]|uniref:CotO family spore coat protein n=1 Tax=Bacillus sp. Marseille-P3661 TaxID=1936234 RepID=UPI000C8345EF|nr:CotO family spore coat protein [Bacillus sp. Marseille-P3661]